MASYITGYRVALEQVDPEVNSFQVVDNLREPFGVTELDGDGVLKVGEEVEIEYLGDDPSGPVETLKILGFYGDGYVVEHSYGLVLYTNTGGVTGALSLETDVNYPGLPVCFTRGTLIDTPDGQTTIENLKAGDMVICSKGLGRVKWIGWRNYSLGSFRMSEEQRKQSAPVRIKRGALEENVPTVDLVVSPWHHIFIDDVLVLANDLINGQTVIQELDAKQVAYFHIELGQFDVVRAHGVFSESWADGGNRNFFENADVTSLRPEDMKRRLADRPGFTVLRDKIKIEGIQNRLLQRALSTSGEERAA